MLVLKQSTSIDIRMGPFVDVGDGFTPEIGITLAGADQAEVLKADGAATAAMAGTFAPVTGADGWYDYTVAVGDVDTVGEVVFVVQDLSVCLPVLVRAQVVEEAVYDALFAASAVGYATPAELAKVPKSDGTATWNSTALASINAEVDTSMEFYGLDHLVFTSVTGTDVANDSIIAQLVSEATIADWDTFDNEAHSLQALRERGDIAWTTGGGGSITDIIQWQPLIPSAVDLANTATYQLGIAVTNQIDNLPTATGEITPGTISIDRKAQGGTSWAAVVTDDPCFEADGLIYYDAVFDTATTYAAGDILRITFKNQIVTVSANDYEITGAGRIFYSAIIADTPDVNIAQISGSSTNVAAMNTFFGTLNGSGQIQAGTLATDTITATKVQDGALTAAKFGAAFLTATAIGADAFTAAKFAADVTTEFQTGLATSAEITALQDISAADVNAQVLDVLTTDTFAEPGAIPAATASLEDKISFLYTLARNKITQTASVQALRNDADSGNIGTAGVSDSGTTFTRDEWT